MDIKRVREGVRQTLTNTTMGIDYHKWDYLDEYSSSDEDEREKVLATLKLKALATDDSRPKGLLLTVPWDTHCGACTPVCEGGRLSHEHHTLFIP